MKILRLVVGLIAFSTVFSACQTAMVKRDLAAPQKLFTEATVTQCKTLIPSPGSVCTATKGNNATLIRSNILTPGAIYQGGDLLINDNGLIDCVGCDCSSRQAAAGATVVTCANGVVSPGLINAHDHINYNQGYPGDWGTERYDQRNDWRKGLRGHTKIAAPPDSTPLVVAWNELRQVISGTTSVAGSGGVAGLLRNLDKTNLLEGLKTVKVDYNVFPLGDTDGTQLYSTCKYPKIDSPDVLKENDCYLPHVAEGVDQVAHNEFLCLSGQESGGVTLTSPKSAFIHTISLLAPDSKILDDTNTTVVWSPRSNISLYGNTAQITLYDRIGVNIAASTDWTPSGSMNLLRELKCIEDFNSKHLNNYFSDQKVWSMVTINPANALAVSSQIGSLAPGMFADIAIYGDLTSTSYFRAVLDAEPKDVALVMRAGKPLYGDTGLMAVLPGAQSGCEAVPGGICSIAKTVCVHGEVGSDFATLAKANTASYPLFYCGTPEKEPTCAPMRPADQYGCGQYPLADPSNDSDGDGVVDKDDNCPTIFNPVRPVDDYTSHVCKQADYDGDGIGDVCDPNPFGKV